MSTTLHERPPQRAAEQHSPARLDARRPSVLERLALRVGVLLISYGRRGRAVSRERARQVQLQRRAHRIEALYLQSENERARVSREDAWARARWQQLPPV